jgi:transposase
MMGQLPSGQNQLFYELCLEDYVPKDHLLRKIDPFLNLNHLRQYLSNYYSHTGRPSVDPELMIRMLIIGYCFGIRSERRLCEEVQVNLAYRWFCRLGLEDEIPNHSTFSKNRHGRFRESDTFRHLFETVLQRCMKEGLVQGEGFATDASIIKADVHRQRRLPGEEAIDWGDPHQATRPVREYLTALEEANIPRKPPKAISLTDPLSSWISRGGIASFGYCTNYLIDIAAGIIVDVEASAINKTAEVDATKKMIDRVEERFEIKPNRLIGDMNYGSAAMLGWLVDEKNILPFAPVWDKSEGKAERYGRSDFIWEADADRYICPAGKSLERYRRNFSKPRSGITKGDIINYRATKKDCEFCPLKARCCPADPARKIGRSIYEEARDVARALAKTDAYAQAVKDRKKVEMSFAHLKRILKLTRLRLRGMTGASDEFTIAATVQNLRKMAKLCGQPPPLTT